MYNLRQHNSTIQINYTVSQEGPTLSLLINRFSRPREIWNKEIFNQLTLNELCNALPCNSLIKTLVVFSATQ